MVHCDGDSSEEELQTVLRGPRGPAKNNPRLPTVVMTDNTKERLTEVLADISSATQKDAVKMHMYVLRSATMLYGACCFLYPLMCLALLLMASEQARDDFIRQPPTWVSTAAEYVYWHGFKACFAVFACSHVFMFVHGQWSTTHHAITKCTEMVNGSDKTKVGNVFWSVETQGGVLGSLVMFLFVVVLGCLAWWFHVTYILDKTANRGLDSLGSLTSWFGGVFSFTKDKALSTWQ